MKRMMALILVSFMVAATLAAGADRSVSIPSAEVPGPRRAAWDVYTPIVDRNIFLRERFKPARISRPIITRTDPVRVAPPTSGLILRGTSDVDGKPVAFFESSRTGALTLARPGDALWLGRVKAVSLDEIEFEIDGAHKMIAVGYSLEGTASSSHTAVPSTSSNTIGTSGSAPPASSTESSASAAAPSTAPAGSSDEAAVLQRLLERRQKEEGNR